MSRLITETSCILCNGERTDVLLSPTMYPIPIPTRGVTIPTISVFFHSYLYNGRWMQPAQQQGRRIPPLSFESAFLIRIPRVSTFLPDVTQQIHSLRASGVISHHTALTAGIELRAFSKSAGNSCTVPPGSCFWAIA